MKKVFSLGFVFIMIIALVACGGQSSQEKAVTLYSYSGEKSVSDVKLNVVDVTGIFED